MNHDRVAITAAHSLRCGIVINFDGAMWHSAIMNDKLMFNPDWKRRYPQIDPILPSVEKGHDDYIISYQSYLIKVGWRTCVDMCVFGFQISCVSGILVGCLSLTT